MQTIGSWGIGQEYGVVYSESPTSTLLNSSRLAVWMLNGRCGQNGGGPIGALLDSGGVVV